jgi:hypothetical protein
MWDYWWIVLLAACMAFGAGAAIWFYTAIDLTRVVSPSGRWLARESRYNTWGIRLMTVGTVLAVVGIALATGHWFKA